VAQKVPTIPLAVRLIAPAIWQSITGVGGLTIPPDRFDPAMDFQTALQQFESDLPLRINWEVGAAAGSIPGENVICSEDNIKTARGALACAGQANPNLPADVTSGRFLADLERITGKSADQFFAEFKNPVTTLATEIGGRLPSENQAAFGNGLAALAREAASMPGAGTQIAVAGGGARGAGFDPDLDSMGGMEDALKGLLGGGQKTEEPGAAGEMQAGGKVARAPAFVSPEDKTISLFDRVKWRYGALIQRERMGEGL